MRGTARGEVVRSRVCVGGQSCPLCHQLVRLGCAMCKAPLAEGGISNAVEVEGDPSGLYTLCDECLAERCAVSLDDSGEAPR